MGDLGYYRLAGYPAKDGDIVNAENAERNLWDQIRSITQISVRLAQWGITTLLGLWTALFFIRKEMLEMLPAVPVGHPLSFARFLPGNLVLWAIAGLFYRMSKWLRKRLFFYIAQFKGLPEAYPGENVKVYPPIPSESKNVQTFWERVIALIKITDNNRTMGIHMGALFFFVPFSDCAFYGLQWLFWKFQW